MSGRENPGVRYVISVIDSSTGSATPAEMSAIDAFNECVRHAGEFVLAVGLADPSTAVVIDGRGPTAGASPGPLHTADEYVSGLWIIDVEDHASAVTRATEASHACNRRVELRAVLGA
jgi:hypothetical protein